MFQAIRLFIVAFSFFIAALPAFALETKHDQRVAFQALLAEIKTHYGMIDYKQERFGVSYAELERKYLRLIDTATTLEEDAGLRAREARSLLPPEEFRQLMIGFAAEFKDGHTNVLRQSNQAWTLGIRTAAIDGKLYIVGFNETFFNPNSTYPRLQIGDQVVAVDGKPVEVLARENALYMSLATENSRQNRALEMILNVSHRWLRAKVTGGPVEVEFRRGNQTIEGRFHWNNTRDFTELSWLSQYLRPSRQDPASTVKEPTYTFGESSTRKTYFSEGLKALNPPRGAVVDIGKMLNIQISEERKKKKAGVSADESLVELEPVRRLAAYTIQYQGKTLGVLRIPNYSPPDGFSGAVNELLWLQHVVEIMENTTHGMIIDQVSNGGGYVYEFAQFVRLFAHKGSIDTAKLNIKLSETFFQAHDEIPHPSNDPEQPVEGEVRRNWARVMLEREALKRLRVAFDRGQKMSGWVSFFGGTNQVVPGEMGRVVGQEGMVYSKPVLLLNDGRSASGGDFMPAALQAAGRAVVMGETSMGLGGPVYRSQESMPGSEMFVRCTMGMCLRGDGLPIENMGVVPDVRREISISDVKEGFLSYARDVLDAAVKLVDGADGRTIDAKLRAALLARHGGQGDESAFRRASELLESFGKGLARSKPTGAKLIKRYEALFAELSQMDLSRLSDLQWRLLELPLPRVLLASDVLLASMSDRRSVLNRLTEMARLPEYARDPGKTLLIETLRKGLSELGGNAGFNACESLLIHQKPGAALRPR